MTGPTATRRRPAPSGRSARPPGRVARVAADARLAWAVALVLAAALAAASVLFAPLVVSERDRGQVESVAAAMAVRLTTFSAGDLEAWSAGVSELATSDYAGEVADLLGGTVRERMAEAGVTSRGRVTDLYVQDLDGRAATAFAVVRQTTSNAAGEGESTVRMTLDLRRTTSGWLVDGVTLLPDPAARPPLDPDPGGG